MTEYISKNEVLNLIEHNDEVCHYVDENCENVVYATAQTICKVVADMPAADVQPVKHGKWEEIKEYGGWGGTYFRCSICGDEWDLDIGTTVVKGMKYCSNCGARMDSDVE